MYQFPLASCPAKGFRLPKALGDSTTTFHARRNSTCPGYQSFEGRDGAFAVGVRQGPSCSVDVGYVYVGPQSRTEEQRRELEARFQPTVERVARWAAESARVEVRLDNPDIKRFRHIEEAHASCSSAASTGK